MDETKHHSVLRIQKRIARDLQHCPGSSGLRCRLRAAHIVGGESESSWRCQDIGSPIFPPKSVIAQEVCNPD
jgi:hypothetical protein